MIQTIKEVAREVERSLWDRERLVLSDREEDIDIIATALQTVRDQALEDAENACEAAIPLKMIATESDAPWAAGKCAEAIRAMKGEMK